MKTQTVIVTGASSGIGKEIARYFLEKGDNVVINSNTAEKLEKVVRPPKKPVTTNNFHSGERSGLLPKNATAIPIK